MSVPGILDDDKYNGHIYTPGGSLNWTKYKSLLMLCFLFFAFLSSCSGNRSPVLGAATLPTSNAILDSRPQSCPPYISDPNTGSGNSSLKGTFPWPQPSPTTNPIQWLYNPHTPKNSPPLRPSNWTVGKSNLKLTSARASDNNLNQNPQELCGVLGNSVDRAWQFSTGSPTTVIAVLDSGVEFCDPSLVDKIYLNPTALPIPENASGLTKAQLRNTGIRFLDSNPYDLNNSGVFNVEQYANDPRIKRPFFCSNPDNSRAGYSGISPEDLIQTFGNPKSPYYYGKVSPAGFKEAISGWNFINNTNDPYDKVHYDHGTGEAEDSSGVANSINQEVGTCPNCMVMPVRVGDSFITSGNKFAEGVLFAVDAGASVIQEALGTLNYTPTDVEAINYALAHGVPIVASAADEESEHVNLPAGLDHMIVVNSVTQNSSYQPPSSLFLNGCTNYGSNIVVSVESSSCSSEATGKMAGIVGLAESYANFLMKQGKLKPYPGLTTVSGSKVALSVNEIKQLIQLTADNIDFGDGAGKYPADNYAIKSNAPLVSTSRYPTTKGFNIYTGYGRVNAYKLLLAISKSELYPQVQINDLNWYSTFYTNSDIPINVTAGLPNSQDWRLQLQVGFGTNPTNYYEINEIDSNGIFNGQLGNVNISDLMSRWLAKNKQSTSLLENVGYTQGLDKSALTVRVVIQDSRLLVGMSRRTIYISHDPSVITQLSPSLGTSVVGPVKVAPLANNGSDALLIPGSDGTVYALNENGKELPGWPVKTGYDNGFHPGEFAYSSNLVKDPPREEIIGGLAVGSLNGGGLDVVVAGYSGQVYAFDQNGKLLPGWPVSSNPNYSTPDATNEFNRLLPGFFAAPVLAHLQNLDTLDVLCASMDRHLYAFSPSGKELSGFPILVVDNNETANIDPVTNQVTFNNPSIVLQGSKLMDSPTVITSPFGLVTQIVIGSNEQYKEPPNADLGLIGTLFNAAGMKSAQTRLYIINNPTLAHNQFFGPVTTVKNGTILSITDVEPALLPDIGDGMSNSPAVLTYGGKTIIAAMADAGPIYILYPDGSSALGYNVSGTYKVSDLSVLGTQSPLARQAQSPLPNFLIPSLGAVSFSVLDNKTPVVMAPGVTVGKALDIAFDENQVPHYSGFGVWNVLTGQYLPGFPFPLNDMAFFDQPISFNGSSDQQLFGSPSAYGDFRAATSIGQNLPGYEKMTGGWVTAAPFAGYFYHQSILTIANRQGRVLTFKIMLQINNGDWTQGRADLENTNSLIVK